MRESRDPRGSEERRNWELFTGKALAKGRRRRGSSAPGRRGGFDVFSLPGGMSQQVPNLPSTRGRDYGPSCPTSWSALIHRCYFQLTYLQEKGLDLARRRGESPPPGPAAGFLHSVALRPEVLDFASPPFALKQPLHTML